MDLVLGPLMRSLDRLKILSNGKRPTVPHAPYTRDMAHIMSQEFLEEPEKFYFRPEAISKVQVLAERPFHGRLLTEIAFPSPIPTRWPQNNTGYAYHLRINDGREHPAMLMLHGWGRRSLSMELRLVGLGFARHGIETLLMVMPYHLRRAPAGSWSGEYMISGDVVRTAESFQQTVVEARAILPWLRHLSPAIGFFGMSLGGIIGHLLMTVEHFAAGITMIAGGNSAGVTWEGRMTRFVRRDIERAGISREQLEKIWAVTNPTVLAPHNKVRNLLMMAGKFDEIVLPKFTQELWEALGHPRIHWYPCAHYSSIFFLPRIADQAARFFLAHLGDPGRKTIDGQCPV
ncbi:MAG TPA: alpha/beta hydrolase family protein [Terriglobia bacterium]|nr:alpha/beta hydrolase family protein [Terriglobia bacterium]